MSRPRLARFKSLLNRLLRRQPEPDPAKSLKNEPFYKFDLSEDFYIRFRCRKCDSREENANGDNVPFETCHCGSTDIWMTRGLNWCLSHEAEFWRDFKTTADIKVPKEARKWLVGQERPMERELMEMRRWIYKKKQQQDELRNAPVVKIKVLEATLGQKVNDKAMVTLDQKTYRVHFLWDEQSALLEPGNFMKENPGPYILRISEPGLGKTLASKILREEAPPLYREAGIEATDVLTIENPADEQRPLVRLIPCHSIQGGGCLAHRVVQQAERGAIAEQKQKQHLLYSLLTILLAFGSLLIFTGLFIMGLTIMQVGIVDAWFQYAGGYLGYIVLGSSLLFVPLFIMLIGGSRIFQTSRTDMLKTPFPIVQHDDKPKYVYDATVVDSATMMGSIQWNAYGNTQTLTNPLYKRVIAGLVHRANDFIADIDEIKNMQHHTGVEMLSVMEDGESIIRNRGSNINTEASGILAIATSEPVPADFMLVANGNMDMIHDPNSIINQIKAFFDRFNYGDMIYYEKYIDATFENQLKIIQVITDETSRFRLYPMEKAGCQRVIEYMRERSDNNQKYKIMFRAVIKVVLKSFEIALGEGRTLTTGDDVETAIVKYCDTIPEQEMKEMLRHRAPFQIVQSEGSAEGRVNGLAVISESAGAAFPVVAETFPVSEYHHGDFVVTGTLKDASSWVQDSIKTVRTVIRKLYGIDIAKDHYTHIAFAEQKDVEGPSAGVAMTLALMSRLGDPRLPLPHEGECPEDGSHKKGHRKPVPLRQDVGVTGTIEIIPHSTDKQNVHVGAIGGVPYKVQGAANVGIKYVIIPQKNFENTLTKAKYSATIFGADSILAYFDLIRADQDNIGALLAMRKPTTKEDIDLWSAERAQQKSGAIKE